ncbi:MAG: N-acetylglucosamine-6-phosphate deacetylase [Thermoleophilia bacterium]|nr:N-acetylglucosamine-6-phosphate deacetylase [Thermoleophilia bacterium]
MRLLTDLQWLDADGALADGWILIEQDRISACGHGDPPQTSEATVESLAGAIVLPGFVDLHCHGGGGASFLSGSTDEARQAALTHQRHGTTTSLGSLASASQSDLLRQIEALLPLVADGTLAGIHLEGPWLAPDYCGAHDPTVLRGVADDELAELLASGQIAMVTLAPEVDGALAAIPRVVAAGAIVAIGHTGADAALVMQAIDAGARVATHLFNAMPPMHHRRPGPVPTLLLDPRVTIELIADLEHVAPAMLELAVRVAGPDRVALITDAIAAADDGDGDHRLGEMDVIVSGGVARLRNGGALAGSTLTQDLALRHLMEVIGVDLAAASTMLSATPARALGLSDRGQIAPGLRADLVVLTPALEVVDVIRAGSSRG